MTRRCRVRGEWCRGRRCPPDQLDVVRGHVHPATDGEIRCSGGILMVDVTSPNVLGADAVCLDNVHFDGAADRGNFGV